MISSITMWRHQGYNMACFGVVAIATQHSAFWELFLSHSYQLWESFLSQSDIQEICFHQYKYLTKFSLFRVNIDKRAVWVFCSWTGPDNIFPPTKQLYIASNHLSWTCQDIYICWTEHRLHNTHDTTTVLALVIRFNEIGHRICK